MEIGDVAKHPQLDLKVPEVVAYPPGMWLRGLYDFNRVVGTVRV